MKTRFLTLLILLLFGRSVSAQNYPVQGSLIVTSPYPSRLCDYANPAMDKLILNLIGTDINLVHNRVRLKLSIYKGTSLMARSNDVVINEQSIVLDGGVPLRLTSADLATYFRMENLQGINAGAYVQPLVEGAYTITWQVFDYFTGNKLSGDISQQFWLMLNEPPLLSNPADKENIQQSSGLNPQIVFQWTPCSTQVSNTEYVFTIVELWDDYGDPYQQFLASPPKYTTTTNNTSFLYGVTEPPLVPGRSYAWRVQAKAKQGMEDIGLYRNDGYSNIYTFKYAGKCDAIQSVNGQVKTSDRIYLEWQQPPAALDIAGSGQSGMYKIQYRKYSSSNQWEWVETETTNGYINLSNLDGNTEYEIKVGNVCDNSLVGYSNPIRLRTKETGTDLNVSCGQAPTVDLSNKTLLQKLSVYDVVMATDFPITITRAEGNSNGWSGDGWVKVPYLADTKIHVLFKGIKVNTDYKLIDGYFETVYNPNGSEIYDVDQTISDVKGIVNDIADLFKMTIDKDAKDIAKLTQTIKDQAAQEMPEALQQKLNTALDAMNDAKKQYDEAKQAYDNALTPQEKEDAKKKLDAAGEKFSKAKDDVKAVQQEQSAWMQQTTDIIVKAIKSLKKDYDSKAADVSGTFAEKEKAWNGYVQQALQSLTGKTSLPQSNNGKNAIMLSMEDDDTANVNDDMTSKAKAYKEAELQNNKVNTIAVFDRDISNKDYYSLLQQVFKVNGKSLVVYFKERKDAGDTEEQLVNNIKTALDSFIGELLTK
jgi:hypothetical protein